jgi:hypothetical protein
VCPTCTVNNEEGECVGFFLPVEVQKYYKLRDSEEILNTNFVVRFYEFHDTSHLLASWWKENKKFTNRRNGWYNTTNLIEPYMYLMALICQWFWRERLFLKYCKRIIYVQVILI